MVSFELIQEDIANVEADALVNAAGTTLKMGGGVAGALKKKGGRKIEEEAVGKGPIELGKAVVTTAGKLDAKYLIHAAAMPHYGDGKATEKSIQEAVRNTLRKADELECKTVAIPAIGCGIAGFPIEKGAKIILDEIKSFDASHIEKVYVVLYTEKDFQVFNQPSISS